MMMQALQAGGVELLCDGIRGADADNPEGYWELEAVKSLPRGEHAWLDEAEGKAVKIIHALLRHLPPTKRYRVVFMQRALREVVASQRVMLERSGKPGGAMSDEQLIAVFEKQRTDTLAWIGSQPHFDLLCVDHAETIQDPRQGFSDVNQFLGGQLDLEKMAKTVRPELHRQQFG